MTVEKTLARTLTFTGVGCRAQVTDQVVVEVDVPGGRQTVNFSVLQLAAVAALVASMQADGDVAELVVANTPPPEPDPVPDPEPTPDPPTDPEVQP